MCVDDQPVGGTKQMKKRASKKLGSTGRELSEEEKGWICFLIDSGFGPIERRAGPHTTVDDSIELSPHWIELASLPPEQLRARYQQVRLKIMVDQVYSRSLPDDEAREWRKKDAWWLHEAVALRDCLRTD